MVTWVLEVASIAADQWGNRAVSQLLSGRPAVQRVIELYVHGGGRVNDANGPGTNERKPVLFVQDG